MPIFNDTMQEIAKTYEKKQAKLVEHLTKSAPFLKAMPTITATHGLKNQYEEVTNLKGAGFREFDSPYQEMDVSTVLREAKIGLIGGKMDVSEERAIALTNITDGARAAATYFDKRKGLILNDAGKQTEKHLIYEHIYKAVIDYNANLNASEKTVFDAGGSSGLYSVLAIRMGKEENCGILSPWKKNGGNSGEELIKMDWTDGGNRHTLVGGSNNGKLGYSVTFDGGLGFQIAMPERVGAIFNIEASGSHSLTIQMLANLLSSIEADESDTFLVMNRFMFDSLVALKWPQVQLATGERNLDTRFNRFNGIDIIATSNMLRGSETKVTGI